MTDEHPTAHHGRAFGRAYWMLNSIEMFERLAYFGIRAVVPILGIFGRMAKKWADMDA